MAVKGVARTQHLQILSCARLNSLSHTTPGKLPSMEN